MNSKTLQMLNVSGNSLCDAGLQILLKGVENHPSLIDLRVAFNDITPVGASSKMISLSKNKNFFLEKLKKNSIFRFFLKFL